MQRINGTVKTLQTRFGFLRDATNREFFFHFQDCDPADVPFLKIGTAVTFELGLYNGRTKAILVKPVTAGNPFLGGAQ